MEVWEGLTRDSGWRAGKAPVPPKMAVGALQALRTWVLSDSEPSCSCGPGDPWPAVGPLVSVVSWGLSGGGLEGVPWQVRIGAA